MTLFGKDLDEVFAYQTPKIVVLKDRRLGLLRLCLLALIVSYIIGFTILYQGKHLSVSDVDGVFRLSLRHPTKNFCDSFAVGCDSNYTSMITLPYCSQSQLPYVSREGVELAKGECQIWDSVESSEELDQGLMLPTRIRRYEQLRGCYPSAENGWTCVGVPYEYLDADGQVQTKPGDADSKYDAFVTDVEHFTLLIDHTFKRYGGMQRDDFEMQGYWLKCPSNTSLSTECTPQIIACAHESCPAGVPRPAKPSLMSLRGAEGRRASIAFTNRGTLAAGAALDADEDSDVLLHQQQQLPGREPVVAVKKGDVFLMKTLLEAANLNLDDTGGYRRSFRQRGLVLVIHINYDNRPKSWVGLQITPWSSTPQPHYTYHVSTRKAADFKVTKTFNDPADARRKIRQYNGIRIVVEQGGKIAVWDTAFFVITVTAALGLMAVATLVTEMTMMYLMPRGGEYTKRKFHISKDFDPDDASTDHQKALQDACEMFSDALETEDGEAMSAALVELLAHAKKGSS